MPLIAVSRDEQQQPSALTWPMKNSDCQEVQIIVGRSVLASLDPTEASTLKTFKRHRILLEGIASNKYDRDGANQIGNIQILAEDLLDADLNK